MFAKMGRGVVIAAVTGLVAGAPAVAEADEWQVGGFPLVGVAQTEGTAWIGFTIAVAPGVTPTITCPLDVTAELFNDAGTGAGEILDLDVAGYCQISGAFGCDVYALTPQFPWTLTVDPGTRVRADGIDLTVTLGGTLCALAGDHQFAGSVSGTWNNATGALEFVNEPGLTAAGAFPVTVNGDLSLEEEGTGAAITLAP